MSHFSAIEDGISPTDRIDPVQPLGADQKKLVTPTPFQNYMQPTQTPSPTQGVPSPFDLSQAGGHPITGKPSMDSLLTQINQTEKTMGDVNRFLNTPNLKLNHAQKYLIGNKLADSKAYINSATSKVGVEPAPPKDLTPGSTPLMKFVALISDGMSQMHAAKTQLEQMKMDGKSLNPGELLLMQVKLGKAQTEIEYASILLSKAVEIPNKFFQIQI